MGAYLIFHAPGNKRKCIRSLPSAHLCSFSWVCFWVNYYWHRHSWKRLSKNLWSLDEVWLITLSLTSCRRAENELLWCSQSPTDISIILYSTRLRAYHRGGGIKIVRDEGDPVWICVFWAWQGHHMHELKELWLYPCLAQDQVSQHSTMDEEGPTLPSPTLRH